MLGINVSITGLDDLRSHLSGIRDQVPFATSRAINNTLNDIQAAVRTSVHSSFIVRRPDYIDKSVYIAPADRAKKDNLRGIVRINPDRDVLAKFEEGGSKTPQRAASLAVPIFNIGSPSIIKRGDPLSIKNLFDAIKRSGAAQGRIKRRKGDPKPIDPTKVYLVTNAKGTYIIERTGVGSTRVLYAFEKAVPLKPQLRFAEIALRTATERWAQNASEALAYAIETAR